MTEIRQRWRLFVTVTADAGSLSHGEVVAAWEAALAGSGLPLAMTDGPPPRPRCWFGPLLPTGMAGEREPLDIALTERRRIHEVREVLESRVPGGGHLVDLCDVWPGAPTLAAAVVAADYRVVLEPVAGALPPPPELAASLAALLAADRIPVVREKGGRPIEVDIRPTLLALHSVASPAGAAGSVDAVAVVRMRLRVGSAGPVGRPADVVTALGDRTRGALRVRVAVRERVVVAGEADADQT